MMPRIARCGAAVAFTSLLVYPFPGTFPQGAGATAAQAGRQGLPGSISGQTYRVEVNLVNVFCSVWNRDTKAFVTNLPKESFLLYEDGQLQEVKHFTREANLPLTLCLLFDTSQSVAPKLKFEQTAATNFFYSVLRERDRAALISFDSGVSLVQDFTDNPNQLAKGVQSLQAAGNTSLYDAIVKTCDEKLIREMGRKAIVILSDGGDTSSTETYERAQEMAQNADATIFSISITRGGLFGVGGDSRAADKVMEKLSAVTGGKAYFPFQVEDLDQAFREISQELRSQYSIAYTSTNTRRDGSFRKIEIRLPEKNLRLNYRQGYFAPKG